ncbi:Tetracycline resistance protein TetA/multidrug resistance protein MdtG, partial [Penicillium frequentans]
MAVFQMPYLETFLYAFIIPILDYMLQKRLHIDHSKTQAAISIILGVHGAVTVVAGPIMGRFADKSRNREIPLVASLLACISGTLMIVCTHSMVYLILGRILQAFAGSAAWILGYATIADTVDQRSLSAIMGIAMAVVNVAVVSGPTISGLLLEFAGYWITWTVPLVILVIDLVARLLMMEASSTHSSPPGTETMKSSEEADFTETTSLLASHGDSRNSPNASLWLGICCDFRVLTVLLLQTLIITVGTCFNATIPLHVQETFGWGPSKVGLLFSCLSLPGFVLGPFAGWLRDRIGTKYPAVISLIIQAGVLVLLGFAGNERVPWLSAQQHGGKVYIASVTAMGALRPLVSGLGPLELTDAVKEHQEKILGIFVPEGLSRVFALMETASSIGMMIGPLLGGALRELFGYDYMSWTWSEWLSLLIGIISDTRSFQAQVNIANM